MGDNQPQKLNYQQVRIAALSLRALNHKFRQQILKMLMEQKTMIVTDIYVKLRVDQSVASQHLAILRKAAFVSTERQGKYIYYSLNKKRIEEVARLVEEFNAE
jgi:ArsR family transcriptional regulator, virulence genes transcriptional regulator